MGFSGGGDKLYKLFELVMKVTFVQLDEQRDSIIWSLTKNEYYL